jgi:hypothetical protein
MEPEDTMSKDLVELMAKASPLKSWINGKIQTECMLPVLKVVKKHIGEVAVLCPVCEGSRGGKYDKHKGDVFVTVAPCVRCNGLGVIAQTDEGGKK